MPSPGHTKETDRDVGTNDGKGKAKKMPNDVLTAFVQLLTKYTAGSTDYLPDTPIRPIKDAIRQHLAIGVSMMAHGYIGKGWMDAVSTTQHPT